MINDIYNDLIMESSMATHNKQEMINPTKCELGHNPSCGDEINLQIKMNNNIIEDLKFTGHGCAISQASTSMMIDLIKGKTNEEAIELINIFIKMITRETITKEEKDKLLFLSSLENISNMPARTKCASLAWYTLKSLLNNL